jgi:antitoxin (DNA-binding transcriptional repressor) of toxin-antitoxin stability system
MLTVQASEVDFQSLLDEVEQGRSVRIERNGRPVAQMHPDIQIDREAVERAMKDILEIRKRTKPVSLEEILAAKNEGRH